MDAQIVSSVVAVVGTLGGSLGGALIGAYSQREAKKIGELERRIERLSKEILARQAEESAAAEWLFSLDAANSVFAAKRKLRERTQSKSGLRPFISPRDRDLNPGG